MKLQYAGFWKRFLAFMVDSSILFIFGFLYLYLTDGLGQYTALLNASSLDQITSGSTQYNYQSYLPLIFAFLYYFLFLTFKNGQTPGRKLVAIKVLKSNGKNLAPLDVIVRYISSYLSAFIFGLGFIWISFDTKKQGWHDKIASTVVVKTGEKSKVGYALFITILYLLFVTVFYSIFFTKYMTLVVKETQSHKSITSDNKATSSNKEVTSIISQIDENFISLKEIRLKNLPDNETIALTKEINDRQIALIKSALQIEPENPYLWVSLGDAYTWVSSTPASADDIVLAYKTAYDLEPNYINSRLVGDSYLNYKVDPENAIIYYSKSVRKETNNPYAYYGLSKAYSMLKLKQKQIENAKIALDQFNNINSNGKYDYIILDLQKLESGEYSYSKNN